jgi:hypothetical protein
MVQWRAFANSLIKVFVTYLEQMCKSNTFFCTSQSPEFSENVNRYLVTWVTEKTETKTQASHMVSENGRLIMTIPEPRLFCMHLMQPLESYSYIALT